MVDLDIGTTVTEWRAEILEDRVVEKLGSAGTLERLSTSIPGGIV